MRHLRDDLALAAWAIHQGFRITQQDRKPRFDSAGIPHDALDFRLGNITVWQTSRGWRMAALNPETNMYQKARDEDFFEKLKDALKAAIFLDIPRQEEAAYAEAKGKLPTVILDGKEYKFVKVDYRFWFSPDPQTGDQRGWQIDGQTEDGQVRRYRYDDGGTVVWRKEPGLRPEEESTVGFFTTGHSIIPEIQRCDATRESWSDDQAAAYALYQVAQQGDPELFARLLTTHLYGLAIHLGSSDDEGLFERLEDAYSRFAINENQNIAGIELPEEVPDWLAAIVR